MNVYEIVEYDDAGSELRKIYDETMQGLGIPFVMNWFKCQGNNPTLLAGNWAKFKATLLSGSIPILLKQLIMYEISRQNNCQYCTFVHQVIADDLGGAISDEPGFKVTENLASDFLPSSYKTAIRTAVKCALDAHSVSDEDFEALRAEGFNAKEVQEILAQADFCLMVNTIADVARIPVDKELLGIG